MGAILDTNDDILGLEERRESFAVLDLKRKYSHDLPQPPQAYSLVRMLEGNRYDYAVMKRGESESYVECGNNELKAEIIHRALTLLDASTTPKPHLSEHIFAYQDGEIEVSKDFLRRLVAFFDVRENRERLEEGYGHNG